MRSRNWLVTLVIAALVSMLLVVVFPPRKSQDKIVLPRDFYSLSIQKTSLVLCPEPKSSSTLIGIAHFSGYPPRVRPPDKISDMIVVVWEAGLRESDLNKPVENDRKKQEQADKALDEKLRSLKPVGLFHVHNSADKTKDQIEVYVRKNGWLEGLMFWRYRFDREWQLIYSETYSYDRAQQIASVVLEKVYGMKCQIMTQ